ncbi:MAG: ABC transporter substrate-binding protein, partial [Burkholderiaceae bacterium]|nr:ABC transporter substrate-binding protein [Burkholderiaceae bacterium]
MATRKQVTRAGLAALSASALLVLAAPAHGQGVIKIGEVNSYKAQPLFLEPYKKGMELA